MSQSRAYGRFNMLGKRKIDPIYVVFVRKDDKKYYLKEFDDCRNVGWWTTDEAASYMFGSEGEVVDFCETFLRKRDYKIEEIF